MFCIADEGRITTAVPTATNTEAGMYVYLYNTVVCLKLLCCKVALQCFSAARQNVGEESSTVSGAGTS